MLVGRAAAVALDGGEAFAGGAAALRLPGAAGRGGGEPCGASGLAHRPPRASEEHPDGKRNGGHPGAARHRDAPGIEGPGNIGGLLFHRHPPERAGQAGPVRREPGRGDVDGAARERRQGPDGAAGRRRPGVPDPVHARGPAAHGRRAVAAVGKGPPAPGRRGGSRSAPGRAVGGFGIAVVRGARRAADHDRRGGADGAVVRAVRRTRRGDGMPHPPPRLRHAHAARRGGRPADPADARPRAHFHDGDLHDGVDGGLEGGT